MSHFLCFNLIQNQSHPFGYISDNGIFHSNSIMLAWGPGTSLRRQKESPRKPLQKFRLHFRCFTTDSWRSFVHGHSFDEGSFRVGLWQDYVWKTLGLRRIKKSETPFKTKTKHQTKIKTRLFIFLIEKGFFLHCIYKVHFFKSTRAWHHSLFWLCLQQEYPLQRSEVPVIFSLKTNILSLWS